MPTLSPLVAPKFVILTTSGDPNDDKIGIMTTLSFSAVKINFAEEVDKRQFKLKYSGGQQLVCEV